MNQFQIVCHACAARLKVTKPSMVGKMLACPKCGTMLQVIPPSSAQSPPSLDLEAGSVKAPGPGGVAPTGSDAQGEAVKTILTQTDFDEIDHLLNSQKNQLDPFARKTIPADRAPDSSVSPADEKPADERETGDATATASLKRAENRGGRAVFRDHRETGTSPENSRTGETLPLPDGPLLPDDQWVSPEIRERKKRLRLLGSLVGLLVLALALAAAWFSRPSTDSTIARVEEVPPVAAQPPAAVGEQEQTDPAVVPPPVEPPTDTKESSGLEAKTPESGSEFTDPLTDPLPTEPPPLGDAGKEAARPAAETELTDRRTPPAAKESDQTDSGDESNDRATEPAAAVSLAGNGPSDADSEADRLNELLESSGFSWTAMRDLVSSLRGEQSFGVPKYYFQQGTIELPDLTRQMETPLPYLKYEQAPLSIILRDLIDLTGIPMTIEPASLQAKLSSIDPKVSIELQDTTIGKGLDEILATQGLTRVAQPGGGLIIFAEGFNQPVTANYSLPRWTIEDPEKRQALADAFIAGTRQLIFPESWDAEANEANIQLAEDQFKVSQLPVVHQQIAELIAKVDAAMAVAKDPLDTAAMNSLATRSEQIARKLERPSGLSHQLSQSFSNFLSQLQKNTEVTLLADWESLRTQGWTPGTRVPGTFQEPTLREVLDEMAQSMGITYVIFDRETVLLTTFETAARYSDLEVYSFGKILAGKLNETQALNLLNRSLGQELAYPTVRVVYEPNYQGLIVVAPQLIQRRIAAVLKALEEI